MRSHAVSALALLCLMAGGAAAAPSQEKCDPSAVLLQFAGLATDIGYVACKAGDNANLTAALGGLTGIFGSLTKEQVSRLPALVNVLLGAPAGSVQPFLSLTPAQLESVLPLLTDVPTDVLAGVLQALTAAPASTLDKLQSFVGKIDSSQLDSLLPLLNSITPQQQAVLLKAIQLLPPGTLSQLGRLVQSAGPIANIVAFKASLLPSIRIVDNRFAPASALSPPDTKKAAADFYAARDSKCPNKTVCSEEDAGLKGLEAAGALTGSGSNDFGNAVCRVGVETLLPALNQTLKLLQGQCPDTLAGLPTLTAGLGAVDPKLVQVFFKIPTEVLQQLVPLLSKLPPSAANNIGALAKLKPQDIKTLVDFLKKVPYGVVVNQIKFIAALTPEQIDTLISLLGSQGPAQLQLAVRLLDKFGFALNSIGAALESQSSSSSTPAEGAESATTPAATTTMTAPVTDAGSTTTTSSTAAAVTKPVKASNTKTTTTSYSTTGVSSGLVLTKPRLGFFPVPIVGKGKH